jgi:GxxExxY protein
MDIDQITYEIRGAIFAVYNELGPGLLESIYEGALVHELRERGLELKIQTPLKAFYKGIEMDFGYRVDLLVENEVIIEIKSVETLHDVCKKQLLTYLKLANKRLGILINFNVAKIQDKVNLIRVINSSAQSA